MSLSHPGVPSLSCQVSCVDLNRMEPVVTAERDLMEPDVTAEREDSKRSSDLASERGVGGERMEGERERERVRICILFVGE
jgi:hypothetical protein